MNLINKLGRTSRTTLVTWLIGLGIARVALTFALGGRPVSVEWFSAQRSPILLVFEAVAAVLMLVLQARRFHDQNRPGYLALIPYGLALCSGLLPTLGTFWLIVMLAYVVGLFLPPTVGPNRYGPDPRGWKSPEHRAEQDRKLRQSS